MIKNKTSQVMNRLRDIGLISLFVFAGYLPAVAGTVAVSNTAGESASVSVKVGLRVGQVYHCVDSQGNSYASARPCKINL